MSQLIINADDLGANAPRSHGIFMAFEQGVVTNATLLPNGSDSDRAAKHARERGLPTGIQLNLTEGYPLSKPGDVATLVSAEGSFLEDYQLRRALAEGNVDVRHLEREIRRQVEWFFDAYGAPTHFASHDHIHTHAVIVPLLIPVLLRYGIRFVRLPAEPLPPFGWEIEREHLEKAQEISRQAEEARSLFEANGIVSTQHFRGLALQGKASAKNLRHILGRLPDGTVELMTHPGSPTPIGTDFDRDPQRQTELHMLMAPELLTLFTSRKITRCSYGDVA